MESRFKVGQRVERVGSRRSNGSSASAGQATRGVVVRVGRGVLVIDHDWWQGRAVWPLRLVRKVGG
jgi:hypothetical protein